MRQVMCSGEALLSWELQQQFGGPPAGDAALHNLYGPTEAAVDVTARGSVSERAARALAVPIGRPIWNIPTVYT